MRSTFNLSHEHKTSVEMGQLIPVQCDEVLPGDTFRQRSTALTRVAPLVHPLMHRVELRMHTFYVPNRILWDGWEDFITAKDHTITPPLHTLTGTPGDLWDYMGVPPIAGLSVSALPLRAINMIWNEFYRDQDLQEERAEQDDTLPRCAWQKDYFTIARPSPQKGTEETIPVTGQLTLNGFYKSQIAGSTHVGDFTDRLGNTVPSANVSDVATYSAGSSSWPNVDMSEGAMIDIDDFRRSIALQRFAEARMRFGSRYVDYLRYLGVNPSDGRLDRPEYLGGGKEVLSFSEVLQTGAYSDQSETNVGSMYGHGIGMGQSNGFQKMFEEHGWVITLLSARPKTVYQNALPRKFVRTEAMDYWQKELEVLPWQEINQREVDASGDAETVFGYVPRFEEYRHGCSHVSSTMRGGTENDWHMGREFATPPTLNGSFVECTPTDRIYQDVNMPDLVLNIQHNITARRFVGQTASMGVDL